MIRIKNRDLDLIDMMQFLGVDFVVEGEGYDEYYLAVPSKQAS